VVAANWMNDKYHRNWTRRALVGNALAIFVLVKLLSLIPVLGWLFSFLIVGLAFGALILSISRKLRHENENLTVA